MIPSGTPSFFILGAAKAGTTTLYNLLRQHPGIDLSFDKEPMFFSRDDYFERGLDWYVRSFFSGRISKGIRGEASPHYLYWAAKVAPRIERMLGREPVRFLAVLRDPVARAYSWYWNMVGEGQETLSFAEALREEDVRLRTHHTELEAAGSMRYGYFRGGCYATQLHEYLRLFPAGHLHVLLLEDLQNDRKNCLRKVFAFLGVDPDFETAPLRSNPSTLPRNPAWQRRLREPSGMKNLAKRLVPRRILHGMKIALLAVNARRYDYAAMPPACSSELRGRFQPEVDALEGMIGRDLSHWSHAS